MPMLNEFHKPANLPAALALLERKRPRTVPLAGGTWLNPRIGKEVPAEAVVDLSGLGLDQIERDPDTLRMGPMATLAAVTQDGTCRSLADGILARTAQRDATPNVRNAATVGGTVVVAPLDSEFVLALLALAAELTVQADGTKTWSLDQFLSGPTAALGRGLVTQVRIHLPLSASAGLARIGRTPSDHPIVAAVAAVAEDADAARVALGGVSPRPLLIEFKPTERRALLSQGWNRDAAKVVEKAIEAAEPYEDFRGSAEYRREMGILMARRALDRAIARSTR